VHAIRLVAACREALGASFRVTIVDNGSTDRTGPLADTLALTVPEVVALHFPERGRGRALRRAFLRSEAGWLGYMDADLSTNLAALPAALSRLEQGAELVIGSRLIRGASTRRRLYREALSRAYNALVRALFRSRVSDHQCGFKFLTRGACRELVPRTEDDLWFFDTELLVLAQVAGKRVDEIPVDWIEDLGSTVHIARTILDDLRGMRRLRRRLAAQGARLP
jgi:glycosyltransferase involved in cell wall biosynthesis